VKVWGPPGSGPGQFQIPHGIATDGKIIYVADRGNARVQRFDLDGNYVGQWTHLGRPFALKLSGGALWVSLMAPSPWMIKVDPVCGNPLGQIAFPGPHSIDVNAAGELFAGGCCGGVNPAGAFLLRAH
jgi:DNA-binding beta-propeller fold protein YncE